MIFAEPLSQDGRRASRTRGHEEASK